MLVSWNTEVEFFRRFFIYVEMLSKKIVVCLPFVGALVDRGSRKREQVSFLVIQIFFSSKPLEGFPSTTNPIDS